jgi:hypothetical protein
MKKLFSNGLFFLAFTTIAFTLSWTNAQTDETVLIEDRRKAVELLYYRDSIITPELSCFVSAAEMDYTTAYFFPENRSDEVYIYDSTGFYYFKIENEKAIPLWTASWPVNSPEGQQPTANNTFVNWLKQSYEGTTFTFANQCGSSSSYDGSLEMFATFSLSEAYKGVISPTGELTCRTTVSNDLEPGLVQMSQYLYGVARCEDSPK